MSILKKKGQRAATLHSQKRSNRERTVRGAKSHRAYEAHTASAYSREPLERAMRGITGRLTPAERIRLDSR